MGLNFYFLFVDFNFQFFDFRLFILEIQEDDGLIGLGIQFVLLGFFLEIFEYFQIIKYKG